MEVDTCQISTVKILEITFVNSIISVQENPAAPSERPPLGALLDTTPVPAATKQQLVKQIEINYLGIPHIPMKPNYTPPSQLVFCKTMF